MMSRYDIYQSVAMHTFCSCQALLKVVIDQEAPTSETDNDYDMIIAYGNVWYNCTGIIHIEIKKERRLHRHF